VITMNWAGCLPGALTCHSGVLQPCVHPLYGREGGRKLREKLCHNQRATALRALGYRASVYSI
jgi:hypothetical protein